MPERSKVLAVIPARLGSTRIPEKMLEDIAGMPLICRTVERTLKAKDVDRLLVATDSERIADAVRGYDVAVMMTPPELKTGTDRVCHAVDRFEEFEPEIVVNVWGDEPMFSAEAIDGCVGMMLEDASLQVGGVADRIRNPEMRGMSSVVQVVTDPKGNALLFSRAAVPYRRDPDSDYVDRHVIGVLAMRRGFMKTFRDLPQTPIERLEGVEQMRILEHGYRMRMVLGDYGSIGVNTPEDLAEVRAAYEKSLTPTT